MYSEDAAVGALVVVGRDSESRLIAPPVFRPRAGQHPPGVRPGLLDEGEQDLGRQRHARLVVVPGPRRQVESACQLRAAPLAEQRLADLSEPAGDPCPDAGRVPTPGGVDFGRATSFGAGTPGRDGGTDLDLVALVGATLGWVVFIFFVRVASRVGDAALAGPAGFRFAMIRSPMPRHSTAGQVKGISLSWRVAPLNHPGPARQPDGQLMRVHVG
jgi:hypothetical protein